MSSRKLGAGKKIDDIRYRAPSSGINFGYDGYPGFDLDKRRPNRRIRKLWARLVVRHFQESAERQQAEQQSS